MAVPSRGIPMSAAIKSGAFFLAANMGAGILNYLYQVVASKQLNASQFSELSAWMAYFSLFLIVASASQYAANFKPIPTHRLRAILIALILVVFTCLGTWFAVTETFSVVHSALIVVSASVFAWLMGEVQTRLLFGVMASANLGVAAIKLIFALSAATATRPLDLMTLGLIAGYLPASLLLAIVLWRSGRHNQTVSEGSWVAPLLLSFVSTLIPQMDMILIHRTQSPEIFEEFARASLFYKGIYFLVFIFSQWLLPQQVRRTQQVPGWRYLGPGYLGLILLSGGIAWASPLAVSLWLNWPKNPSPLIIFLSCWNIGLLAWIYMHLQKACAEGRLKVPVIASTILVLEILWQLYADWSLNGYYSFALVCQTAMLVWVMRSTR